MPAPPAESGRMDLPVVVIGANCAILGAAAVSDRRTRVLRTRHRWGRNTVWSLQPEQLAQSGS